MKFVKSIVAAGLVVMATPSFAADITGAGSTFIFPVLSKWADAYKKDAGSSVNYQRSARVPASSRSKPIP